MEVRIKCKVKNLKFSELKRSIAQNEVADFTNVEYQRSASLRTAIRDGWVEVLKKAKTATPKPEVKEKPEQEEKPKGKKRGRKPKSEKIASKDLASTSS